MALENLDHFIYVENPDTEDVEVHIATLCCDERPAYLKFTTFKVKSDQNKLETVSIGEREIPYFGHTMKIQDSTRFVSNEDDIVSILKSLPGTFGVWSLFQLEYFETILQNVIDIAQLVKQALKERRLPGPAKTISDFYLELLPKFEGNCHYSAWKYFFAKMKSLREIECLAFREDDDNIYVAKSKCPPYMHVSHVKVIDFRNSESSGWSTQTPCKVPFEGQMKIDYSRQHVRTRSVIEEILQRSERAFGVWGKEQYDYFSKYLENVVDVKPLFLQELSKLEPDDKSKMYNVPEMFLEMLRTRARNTVDQKEFREWIENEGWASLFKDSEQPADQDNFNDFFKFN